MKSKKLSDVPVALVTGCFDVLHRGHLMLLLEAWKLGNVLVGINSDRAVRLLKGPGRPVNCEDDRRVMLQAIVWVDEVFIIDSTNVASAIEDVKPNFWVKGGDYSLKTLDKREVKAARKVGAKIIIVPSVKGYSTSKTLAKAKR